MSRYFGVLVLCYGVWVIGLADGFINSSGMKKLPFYVLVKVPTEICRADYQASTGVCLPNKRACTRMNGTDVGKNCYHNIGVCCAVTLSCSDSPETVTANGTHLVNPRPLQSQMTCEWDFPRPKGVCQIRLDFLNYQTNIGSQPLTGDCLADTLTISGASNIPKNFGPLCGNLTGQHVYLDYGNSDSISLQNYIDQAMGQGWDIQVTYIKCDSTERAPTGCLQYYTEPTGTVMSFNFGGGQQTNNQDYSVCIKSQPGMNSITWNTCGGFDDFVISGQEPIPPPIPGLDPIINPVTGTPCMYDWVMIYGVDKYCGNFFTGPVTSMSRPFLLQVHFNEWELSPDENGLISDADNAGFCLRYRTSP